MNKMIGFFIAAFAIVHSFFNGAFLVKRLRHDFDFGEKKHKTHMTLVKDSLDETLDGSGNPEPKSGSAKIIDSREELYPRL